MEMIGAMMQAKSGFVIIFAAFARYIAGNRLLPSRMTEQCVRLNE